MPCWARSLNADFYAFREVKWFHYPLLLLFRAPNLLVYTALELFDVPVVLEEMLVFLPMIFLAATCHCLSTREHWCSGRCFSAFHW